MYYRISKFLKTLYLVNYLFRGILMLALSVAIPEVAPLEQIHNDTISIRWVTPLTQGLV